MIESFERHGVIEQTVAARVGHPLADGLTAQEMQDLRAWLDHLDSRARGGPAVRQDGKPRRVVGAPAS